MFLLHWSQGWVLGPNPLSHVLGCVNTWQEKQGTTDEISSHFWGDWKNSKYQFPRKAKLSCSGLGDTPPSFLHFCLCPLPAISGPLWTRCPIPGPHCLCPHPPGGWALTPSGCWPSAHTALCTGVHTPKYNQFTTSSHSTPHRTVLCLRVRTES